MTHTWPDNSGGHERLGVPGARVHHVVEGSDHLATVVQGDVQPGLLAGGVLQDPEVSFADQIQGQAAFLGNFDAEAFPL